MSTENSTTKTVEDLIADQRAAGKPCGVVIARYTADDALADAVADRLATLETETEGER